MMRYNTIYHTILLLGTVLAAWACSSKEGLVLEDKMSGEPIEVGVDTQGLCVQVVETKAAGDTKDAETISWLVQPLKQGLDITYGNLGSDGTSKNNQRVAILKLLGGTSTDLDYDKDTNSGYAKYSFCYRGDNGSPTEDKARWYENGLHYFEGVHVPNRLRYKDNVSELATDDRDVWGVTGLKKVTSLTTDQSGDESVGTDNDLGNYTLLEHYLGMPANTLISATVGRIKLPFRHRLSRVLAYILIDPGLKTNGQPAKIRGYKSTAEEQSTGKDNPVTTSIRFCNVDLLEGVHDLYSPETQHHTLVPKWAEKVRKVVPHFEEETSVTVYEKDDKTLYPMTSGYDEVHSAAGHNGYTPVVYAAVPVYDLIVRPTYTSYDNVMYDEDGYSNIITRAQLANRVNQINFTVSLDNGLTYEKHFEFDLDANYQTVVYLKITREGVDYNESGSVVWEETTKTDDYYGVDNKNGNTLSKAGGSWQRAFYNTDQPDDKVTDGDYYDEETSGQSGRGQYLTDATWIKNFLQAYEGGDHHGDYFVLAKNITIDARDIPENFVFTGHLDAFNTQGDRNYNTITLSHIGETKTEYVATTDYSISPLYADQSGTVFSLPSPLYKKQYRPAQAAVYYQNAEEYNAAKGTSLTDEQFNALSDEEKIKTPAVPEGYDYVVESSPTIQGAADNLYYKKIGENPDNFEQYHLPTLYKAVVHTGRNYLFYGLNGIYSTAQEEASNPYSGSVVWEANVHKEGSYWIPYKDTDGASASNTGWRAEVMNLTLIGGTLFEGGADAAGRITGSVQNCYQRADASTQDEAVADKTPAYPKYK